MKKLTTYLIVAASLVYYAFLPMFLAKADSPFLVPSSTGNPPGVSTLAFNGNVPVSIKTILYLRVTAYASVPDETSDHPFIMADGHHVYDGAAASNILPFGTKIEIPALFGNKIFTIEDHTSPRFSQTIDLWMPTVTQAIDFGVSHTNIIVLAEEPTSTQLSLQ